MCSVWVRIRRIYHETSRIHTRMKACRATIELFHIQCRCLCNKVKYCTKQTGTDCLYTRCSIDHYTPSCSSSFSIAMVGCKNCFMLGFPSPTQTALKRRLSLRKYDKIHVSFALIYTRVSVNSRGHDRPIGERKKRMWGAWRKKRI